MRSATIVSLALTLAASLAGVGCQDDTTKPAKLKTPTTQPAAPASAPAKPTVSLHDAARDGKTDQVRLHVAAKADLDARDEDGKTALALAADRGHLEVVKVLVSAGADVNARNTGVAGGSTPLHMASGHRNREPIMQLLIDNGAKVNTKGMLNATPLHIASLSGYPTNINLLLKHGADIAAVKDGGATALHEAARGGTDNASAVEALIAAKADVKAVDGRGQTALHLAASEGNQGAVKVLLANGADVNAKDKKDRTPIYYASRRRKQEVVELLKKAGAQE